MATFPTKRTPDQRTYAAFTVTTAADGLSDVVDCGGLQPVAFETSTAWTAAGINFLGSGRSSSSMYPLYGSTAGTLLRISSAAIATGAGHIVCLNNPARYAGIRFLQLQSGSTASTAIVQGAARTVYVYLAVPQGPIK